MAFWIFMLVTDLLIPVTMIGFGGLFWKKSPETINPLFGYRTSMSRKSDATWAFAHHYFGRLWFILGWITFAISLPVLCLVIGKDTDTVGTWGGILCMFQIIPLLVPIIPTELALRKHFDSNGVPKM